VAAYINGVCPVVDATLSADGSLRFANAAVDAGAATAPAAYTLQWFTFDNTANEARDVGEVMRVQDTSAQAPAAVSSAEFAGVRISSDHPEHKAWSSPVSFTFRRAGTGWTLVGVER
jgi:hypothetical protein